MKPPSSNQVYLWSKRFGAILLIAMAIVAAGNAQQFSASEKGKVKRRSFRKDSNFLASSRFPATNLPAGARRTREATMSR